MLFYFFYIRAIFLSNIQWAIPYKYYENGFEKLGLVKNYNRFNPFPMKDLNLAFDTKKFQIISLDPHPSRKYIL